MQRGYYIFGLLALILVFATASFVINKRSESNTPPPVLVKNFVDLDKIEKISKFRSCQGHTVVPVDGSESKRNMKHYFVIKPEYQGKDKVALYVPYDSRVAGIRSAQEEGLEGEIWLDGGSEWQFSIEHIQLLDTIKENNHLKAGQLLGYVPDRGFDIVYAIGASSPKVIDRYTSPFAALDSVFSHMDDGLFKEFEGYGVNSTQDFIYTKEYRDANPCIYRGDGQGGLNDFEHPEDWVILRKSI